MNDLMEYKHLQINPALVKVFIKYFYDLISFRMNIEDIFVCAQKFLTNLME